MTGAPMDYNHLLRRTPVAKNLFHIYILSIINNIIASPTDVKNINARWNGIDLILRFQDSLNVSLIRTPRN